MTNKAAPVSGNERASTHAPASVQPVESENGNSEKKNDQHEALEHNVQTGQHQRHPEEVAAQHATGSFTGKGGPGGDKR